jgi:nitrite reductase/ring-hydroxylating ferredoxin subunit
LSDWRYTAGAERRVGVIHAALNVLATGTYGVSWWLRGRGHTRAGVACSLVGAASLAGSGWLGGHLAYALGVGVDTTAFQHGLAEWTDVAAEADVPPEAPLGVEIDGVPVVLFRSAEHGISALADRCTHRGGPLHEGTTRDGAVVCPWHGSCFSATGAVVSGPATRPQPRYAVRVEAGRVLVGRTDEVRSLRVRPAGR